jgi:hypothetical protein
MPRSARPSRFARTDLPTEADPLTVEAAQAATHARDLRGAAKLATEATTGLTDLVEAVHARIASLPGLPGPADGRTRGIAGLVYKTIRGVTKLVGGSVDTLLEVLAPALGSGAKADAAGDALPSREREALVAALNGVLGDHLARSANPLAIQLALRHEGRPLTLARDALAHALPHAGPRPLVLIHGLCMNDLQWRRRIARDTDGGDRGDTHDHGAALADALGFTPVYLHYNSGLHVSTNGRALATLLEQLLHGWPQPVERFAILAHSMGGLLARSALHHGRAAGHHWPDRLDDLAFLGTPHHGAPLERAGQGLDLLLSATPYAGPFGRLAKLRSAGITDLRHGNLLDADWSSARPIGARPCRCRPARAATRSPARPAPRPATCGTSCSATAWCRWRARWAATASRAARSSSRRTASARSHASTTCSCCPTRRSSTSCAPGSRTDAGRDRRFSRAATPRTSPRPRNRPADGH